MNRIPEIEIAGGLYPLCLSIKAVKKICEKYGDLDKMLDDIERMKIVDQLTEIIWLLQLMLEQGANYQRIHEGKEVKVFSADDLEVLFTAHDIGNLYTALTAAMEAGTQREVEAAVDRESESKNGKATQD